MVPGLQDKIPDLISFMDLWKEIRPDLHKALGSKYPWSSRSLLGSSLISQRACKLCAMVTFTPGRMDIWQSGWNVSYRVRTMFGWKALAASTFLTIWLPEGQCRDSTAESCPFPCCPWMEHSESETLPLGTQIKLSIYKTAAGINGQVKRVRWWQQFWNLVTKEESRYCSRQICWENATSESSTSPSSPLSYPFLWWDPTNCSVCCTQI